MNHILKHIGYYSGLCFLLLSFFCLFYGLQPILSKDTSSSGFIMEQFPGEKDIKFSTPGKYVAGIFSSSYSVEELRKINDIEVLAINATKKSYPTIDRLPFDPAEYHGRFGLIPLFNIKVDYADTYKILCHYPSGDGPNIQMMFIGSNMQYVQVEMMISFLLSVLFGTIALYLIIKRFKHRKKYDQK